MEHPTATRFTLARKTVCMIIALALATAALPAATINVTTTQDALANDGTCSLREAVIAANSNSPSGGISGECPPGSSTNPDTINLPAGTFPLTLVGSESPFSASPAVGDLDITQSLNIQGLGSSQTVVSGAILGARIFHIEGETARVTFTALRISDGNSPGDGGGIFFDDGLSLSLSSVSVTNNQASGYGGGIQVTSTADLTIANSTINGNTAGDGAGGGLSWAGCLGCTRTLSISGSLFEGNQAIGSYFPHGGGIHADGGTFLLVNSRVTSNHADGRGGGLWVEQASFSASGSSIDGNSADGDGGGIYFDFVDTSKMDNCTLSGNIAEDRGGGLALLSNDAVTLTHCTLYGNTASEASAIWNAARVILANTLVAGSCGDGSAASLGGNIESPGANCGLGLPSDRSGVTSTQLALGSLAANGGFSPTHLPAADSVAVNTAISSRCLSTDQRGVSRPQGPACDVGSVEYQPVSPALLLQNGRFRLESSWRTTGGTSGVGQPVQMTSDTGYFWFFNSSNVEFVVKILNACGLNNRYWIFAGGLTDVFVELRVTDTLRSVTKTYTNPQGHAFQPIQDTNALATCP